MEATLPDELLVDDEKDEIGPLAEKVAIVAALYATELTVRWRGCMESNEEFDQERDPDAFPSTKNLTKPPLDTPPSNN
jgi:hypothetical protein